VTGGFESGWGGGAYPPPGYLPWNILDVGNGDTYGYYWPIGREDGPPVVCTLMHDAGALLPVASSLASCIRLHLLARNGNLEELVETARTFAVDIADIPMPERDNVKNPSRWTARRRRAVSRVGLSIGAPHPPASFCPTTRTLSTCGSSRPRRPSPGANLPRPRIT
jgi:hypothetical protein